MADKKPPLSTQTSNQKCDRLDFDNDFGGKIAARGGSQQENSDLEDGEIFSCDSTDDETIEELTAKQKLLQSFLVEAEQNSSSCVEDGEINDQNNTLGDPDPEVIENSSILNGKGPLGECKKSKGEKLNLKKTVHEHKTKDYHPKKGHEHSNERKREYKKDKKDIPVHTKASGSSVCDKTESKVKKVEKEDKDSPRLGFNSFLAECKKTRGGQTTTIKSKSRQCPHNKSPERKMEYDNKYHQKEETSCQAKEGEITKVNDNFEEMMDNLDEMPVDSSNSDNENDERVDDIKTDSNIKRKHSSETRSPINPEQFDEQPNKKIKTDEADDNSDDYKSFPNTQEFQIIDDLNAEEADDCRVSEEEGMLGIDDDYMSDDLDDNEIYAWLEEGISRKPGVDNETDEIMPVDEKEKSVLLGRISF